MLLCFSSAEGESLPPLECSEGRQSLAGARTLREGGVGVACEGSVSYAMSPGRLRTGSFQRLLGSRSHRSPRGWLAWGGHRRSSGPECPEWTGFFASASAKRLKSPCRGFDAVCGLGSWGASGVVDGKTFDRKAARFPTASDRKIC